MAINLQGKGRKRKKKFENLEFHIYTCGHIGFEYDPYPPENGGKKFFLFKFLYTKCSEDGDTCQREKQINP